MATPTASPQVSSTVGLKNVVIAPLTKDTETEHTYGALQLMAGAIEASITPENADPDVQHADDVEFDVLYPDPELTFKTKMADVPLAIQEMVFGNQIDDNGVLVRTASDRPPYFAVGFKSEKSDGTFRYVWLFKVRAKPVTENYATKEGTNVTRQTGEIEWTAIKRTHDNRVQHHGGQGRQIPGKAAAAHPAGQKRRQQGRQRAEHHIVQRRAGDEVCQQAACEQARDSS